MTLMSSAIPPGTQMSRAMPVNITLTSEIRKAETLTVVSSYHNIKPKNILIETLICKTIMESVVNLLSKKPGKIIPIGAS